MTISQVGPSHRSAASSIWATASGAVLSTGHGRPQRLVGRLQQIVSARELAQSHQGGGHHGIAAGNAAVEHFFCPRDQRFVVVGREEETAQIPSRGSAATRSRSSRIASSIQRSSKSAS